jgi:L-ribulose-5-phosphate 3-epimerase
LPKRHDLGVENVLVVPGAVHIPWRDDHEPVPNDVCDQRAREAVGNSPGRRRKLKVTSTSKTSSSTAT